MPLYDYRCEFCDFEIEDLQKHDDPPPVVDAPCTGADSPDAHHHLYRAPTTFVQRWRGEHSNDGIGGWKRQGEAMVRATSGRESTKYGEGTV